MKIIKIRLFTGILTIACIIAATNYTHSAEFTADLFQQSSDKTIISKYYIKGSMIRMETTSGPITIINLDKGKFYMLYPQQMMYMTMPNIPHMSQQAIRNQKDISDIAEKKHLGKEKINGYKCDKYQITYKNSAKDTITQWYSEKLGYPVKIISQGRHGKIVTEYKNIREDGISNSLFEIPSEYRMMPMPAMPNNGRHMRY